ncbi:MAG TPA: hypothetical protein VHF22_05355, partial [Planctomycetota bacterium]|nr:hypothetical protein [Planctomycetota bacterium]
DLEVRRRRDIWVAIDRFSWPQFKEPQFGQLELATRTEADLLRYVLQSPPMRDLVLPPAPDGPPPELPDLSGFADWRSRALFQVRALERLLGGLHDVEARRRAALWLAIDRFAWPHLKEQQFAQVELATRTEVELLGYVLQAPPARDLILRPPDPGMPVPEAPEDGAGNGEAYDTGDAYEGADAGGEDAMIEAGAEDAPRPRPSPAPSAAHKRAKDPGAPPPAAGAGGAPPAKPDDPKPVVVEDAFDPLGEIAPTEKYVGPSAGMLYQEGQKAWAEYAANEFKQKSKAREAARRLKEIFILLDKNPDSETQLKALEQVVGLSLHEVLDGRLEKRLKG